MTTSVTKSRKEARRRRLRAHAEGAVDAQLDLVRAYRALAREHPGWGDEKACVDELAYRLAWDSAPLHATEEGLPLVGLRSEILRVYGERENVELPDSETLGRVVARMESFPRSGEIH